MLSDFDGTLAPIVADPERSEADPRSLAALRLLAGAFATVAVVSGRPASFVAARLELAVHPAPIRVLGLYGLEEADARGVVTLDPTVSAWSRVVTRVAAEARAALPRGVLVEDKGATLALHWRARPDAEGAILAFAEHAARLDGLELSRGKMVAELLPPVGTDKGSAVRQLASTLGAACFIGDDLGDVPAFEELRRLGSAPGAGAAGRSSFTALRIAVVGGETPPDLIEQADVGLEGTSGVAEFLAELARVVRLA